VPLEFSVLPFVSLIDTGFSVTIDIVVVVVVVAFGNSDDVDAACLNDIDGVVADGCEGRVASD
jgi:hypothetical protein